MCMYNKPLLILGDFNDNLFAPDNSLNKIFYTLHLTQYVNKPTRITSTSSTLLDLIISNRPNLITHFDVVPSPVGDHELVTATINVKKEKTSPITKTYRCQKNYSQNHFCSLLLDEADSLNSILQTDCVDNQVKTLTTTFIKCLDVCAPIVTKETKRPPAPWIDAEVKIAMSERDRLHKEFKRDRQNTIAEENYKSEKKRVKSLISLKKRNFYREKFEKCKGNIKGTWSVIRQIIPENNKSQKSFGSTESEIKEKNRRI